MKKFIALGAGLALMAGAVPAFAQEVTVEVSNNATITNTVTSSASSGGNEANGAAGDNLITGGNLTEAGSENSAGNDGAQVLGGYGGSVKTGAASALTEVRNRINTSRTRVEAEPWDVQAIAVAVSNDIEIGNEVDAAASSGDNVADGDEAVNTIEGGNIAGGDYKNTAGNSDSYVEGGTGGTIETGEANSTSRVVNVLNRTVTRVRR